MYLIQHHHHNLRASSINNFLHVDLYLSTVKSNQFKFSIAETFCSLFDRQLKPNFVLLDLVSLIPKCLSLCNKFSVNKGDIKNGIWYVIKLNWEGITFFVLDNCFESWDSVVIFIVNGDGVCFYKEDHVNCIRVNYGL